MDLFNAWTEELSPEEQEDPSYNVPNDESDGDNANIEVDGNSDNDYDDRTKSGRSRPKKTENISCQTNCIDCSQTQAPKPRADAKDTL